MSDWNYCGDVNLRHGGYYWKRDGGDDYADIVEIIAADNMGGPDNLFLIRRGTVYLPNDQERRKEALECIGVDLADATSATLVDAFMAYHGADCEPGEEWLAIGRIDPRDDWRGFSMPDDIKTVSEKTSLRGYVRANYGLPGID